jgi:hypothetical protein
MKELVAAAKQYRQLAQANSEETSHPFVLSPFPVGFDSSSSASGSHSAHRVQEVAVRMDIAPWDAKMPARASASVRSAKPIPRGPLS